MQWVRRILMFLVARPLAYFFFGIDAVGREKLPQKGPAIVAANHNSHVDTLILLCLFPSKLLPILRPVAAADTFDKGGFSSWFSKTVIGIIPIKRGAASRHEDVLAGCKEALARGEILVVFPEGSRGEPEEMTRFKTGVARLAEFCPEAPVTPVYIQGAGRSLPRDAKLVVPFNCTVIIGEAMRLTGAAHSFVEELRARIEALKAQAPPLRWK